MTGGVLTGAVGGAVGAVGGTVGGVVDTAVSGITAVTGFEASVVSFIITSFTTVLQVHTAPIFLMLPPPSSPVPGQCPALCRGGQDCQAASLAAGEGTHLQWGGEGGEDSVTVNIGGKGGHWNCQY